MRTSTSFILVCMALGCGGSAATQPAPEPEPVAPPPAVAEPEEPEEPAPAPAVAEPAAPEEPAEPAPEAPPPAPEPVVATTADEVKEALRAAATDVVALRRLVDPERGIGVYDPTDAGVAQYCDVANLASEAGVGFVIGFEDPFSCDRDLERCQTQGNNDGYAFLLRHGSGDTIYLDAIVHYDRRVPRTDPRAVRAFAEAGDGVCVLFRTLRDPNAQPPAKLSVFVSGATGLVPETLTEHRCDERVAQAWTERVAPAASGHAPDACDRNPTRCVFTGQDTEVAVYADDAGTPTAVAVTRPGMRQNLARAQERELQAFLRSLPRAECDEEEAAEE